MTLRHYTSLAPYLIVGHDDQGDADAHIVPDVVDPSMTWLVAVPY